MAPWLRAVLPGLWKTLELKQADCPPEGLHRIPSQKLLSGPFLATTGTDLKWPMNSAVGNIEIEPGGGAEDVKACVEVLECRILEGTQKFHHRNVAGASNRWHLRAGRK